MINSLLTAGVPVTYQRSRTMSLCLLEFWVPLDNVSGAFALCMSAMVMNKSMMSPWIVHIIHTPMSDYGSVYHELPNIAAYMHTRTCMCGAPC